MNRTSRFTAIHAWAFALLAFFAPVAPLAAALPDGNILFEQAPEAVDSASLLFYFSDESYDDWLVADDFSGLTADIGGIHWYGFTYDSSAPTQSASVDPAGTLFEITFYEDASGSPGSIVAQFSDVEPAYEYYADIHFGDGYRFDFDLPAPVSLAAGWVSIQSTYSPDGSSFVWWNSADGNLNGVHSQYGGAFFAILNLNRSEPYGDSVAFSLTSRPSDLVISSMAAPNIAEIILEAEAIDPQQSFGKGKNRTFINLIQQTAEFMGPGTDFDGVPKYVLEGDPGEEIQSLNPDYWQAVLDFLNARITYYGLAIGPLTYSLEDFVYGGEPDDAILEEDFTESTLGDIPVGWGETAAYPNWFIKDSTDAGGTTPEMVFSWYPDFSGLSRLVTPDNDATGWTELELTFKHSVNDFWGQNYTLKVQVSTDGGATWTSAWSINPSDDIAPETVTVDLSAYDGQTFQLAWVFDGESFGINYWYIDDILITGN